MAKAYSARCLVLKHTKLGETDAIVTLLSQDGEQIRGIAKGLRKPGNRIGARLQLFTEADILLHEGRSLDTVREVRVVQTNARIQDDLERIATASVVAEVLERLGRDGASLGPRMYRMSASTFDLIGYVDADKLPLLLSAFLMKAMSMQGFAPAVNVCATCGDPIGETHAFDVDLGGAICAACVESMGLSMPSDDWARDWTRALVYSTYPEILDVDAYPRAQLLELSEAWLRSHADIRPKSMAFLKTILRHWV